MKRLVTKCTERGAVLTVPTVIKSIAQVRPDSKGEIDMESWVSKAMFDFYFSAPAEMMEKPWRVYGSRSRRRLCSDYRYLTSDNPLTLMEGIDSMEIVSFADKGRYYRIVVAEPKEAGTTPEKEPAATETAEPEKEVCTTPAQEERDMLVRKLEAENEIMRKALQEIVAYDVHKYIPENLREIFAESPYAAAYGIIQEYAEAALADMERGLRYS